MKSWWQETEEQEGREKQEKKGTKKDYSWKEWTGRCKGDKKQARTENEEGEKKAEKDRQNLTRQK